MSLVIESNQSARTTSRRTAIRGLAGVAFGAALALNPSIRAYAEDSEADERAKNLRIRLADSTDVQLVGRNPNSGTILVRFEEGIFNLYDQVLDRGLELKYANDPHPGMFIFYLYPLLEGEYSVSLGLYPDRARGVYKPSDYIKATITPEPANPNSLFSRWNEGAFSTLIWNGESLPHSRPYTVQSLFPVRLK